MLSILTESHFRTFISQHTHPIIFISDICSSYCSGCITTDWSDWSECSTTCEKGEIVRMRAFEDPSEQNACPDVKVVDIQPCDLGEC
jgi:hypothetical protein